jgi:hypothetical protein
MVCGLGGPPLGASPGPLSDALLHLPVAATADICGVDPRTVQRLLEKGGQRAQDFHQLQLERAQAPLEAVQLDEMHGHVAGEADEEKKGFRRWLRRWA